MKCDTGVSCVLASNQDNEYDCGVIYAGNCRNIYLYHIVKIIIVHLKKDFSYICDYTTE